MLYYCIHVLVNALNKYKTSVSNPNMAGFWAENQDFLKPEIMEVYFKKTSNQQLIQGSDYSNVFPINESRAARERSPSLDFIFFLVLEICYIPG